MKINLIVATFCMLSLISCDVAQSKNIYSPPINKIKPIENFFYYSDPNSLEIIKNEIKKTLLIGNDNLKNINSSEISSFIDCGYMNEEIYVDYINRIFDSSLSIKIIFSDRKLNDKDVVFVDFDYTFKSKETGTTWRFSTARSKDLLVGNPVYDDNPYRECSSTQKIESSLKNVLEYQL